MRADALSDRDDVNSFRKIPTADAELQTLNDGAVAGGRRAHLVTIEDADTSRRVFEIGKTMIDPEVTVLHTGRRAHQVGWPRSIVMRFRLQPIICQRMEGDSLISDTGFRRISEDSRLRFASRYPACTSSSEAVSDETATCRAKSSRALTEGLSD
jgi:hypothetical protein